MSDKLAQNQNNDAAQDSASVSWWSWRPGIKPRNAVIFGGLLAVLGLLLTGIGLFTLIVGIVDADSSPIQIPGTVMEHTTGALDSLPHLTIRLREHGNPEISPAVSQSASKAISDGDAILLDYSPRLQFLYALDFAGHRYNLPGSSAGGNPANSLALLLIGLVLFPYPALLTRWGWLDMHANHGDQVGGTSTIIATVVALRSTQQVRRTNRPGLTPRFSGSWYGVALQPLNSDEIRTFSIREQAYPLLRENTIVEVAFSPQLHYVYSIEERNLSNSKKA